MTHFYLIQVKDEIYLYSLTTGERLKRIAPDFVGAANIYGRREHPWFFATLTGFTNPGIVARYDFRERDEEKRWGVYRATLISGLDPNDFIADQVY